MTECTTEMSTIGPDREDEEDNHAPQSVDALGQ